MPLKKVTLRSGVKLEDATVTPMTRCLSYNHDVVSGHGPRGAAADRIQFTRPRDTGPSFEGLGSSYKFSVTAQAGRRLLCRPDAESDARLAASLAAASPKRRGNPERLLVLG